MKYCIIMAGGVGTRFWPISRTARPKQFLDILGTGKSFIRATFERFLPIVPAENFLVITSQDYTDLVLEELPELHAGQVLGEAVGRNTAPCIAWAAYKLLVADPEAEMVVTPADHLITNEPQFQQAVGDAFDFIAHHDALMTIGIHPSRPDTGYGYIQVGAPTAAPDLHKVKTFTEKPSLDLAQAFIESGEFFWNSGIFIWRAATIRDALTAFMPEMAQRFAAIDTAWGTPAEKEQVDAVYSELRPMSIDVGVMERAGNAYVRCADFGWSDVGTWGSLYQNLPRDDHGNALPAEALTYDTTGCIVRLPEGMLAAIEGLHDYIVAQSGNVLMICPKANEQSIKRYIDDLKYAGKEEFI